MINCISCKRYPTDQKVIPYGSTFPIDEFLVELITYDTPSTLPTNGSAVEELPNNCKFAVGSKLYVVNGTNGSEVYIYGTNGFAIQKKIIPSSDADETSDVVDVGQADYMEITS